VLLDQEDDASIMVPSPASLKLTISCQGALLSTMVSTFLQKRFLPSRASFGLLLSALQKPGAMVEE
jgi:hypothetical protein